MTNVQVRDVPPDVVADLKELAAERNQSLQGFLRDVLVAQASVKTTNRILDRAAARSGLYEAAEGETAEEIRQAREDRDRQLELAR